LTVLGRQMEGGAGRRRKKEWNRERCKMSQFKTRLVGYIFYMKDDRTRRLYVLVCGTVSVVYVLLKLFQFWLKLLNRSF
jgi:hypothetical protein